mmetsp:Transcript_11805/g.24390  ORF Transcript_11805/g.24390 Transcript_11805/m.24390 type:complete len:422 (+) Transcript_11805:95-1360(+)
MAITKRVSFAVLLSALLSASVSGQTNIQFDRCGRSEDERLTLNNGDFENDRGGSMRRTYGNLCTGTQEAGSTNDDDDMESRIGHPFRIFCDVIDRNPSVKALLSTGNSPHTVFAPTDAAFAKVDGLISRVNEQRLIELHILPQARLSRDLRCGQTYRTINTNQSRRDNQRSKTRCINASRAQQLGPGNIVNGLKPTIGVPDNIFRVDEFQTQRNFVVNVNVNEGATDADRQTFSEDVISCNGVIHVVDEVLLPGATNTFRFASNTHGQANYDGGHSHSHGIGGYSGGYGGNGGYRGGYYGGRGYGGNGGQYGRNDIGHSHGAKGRKGAKGFKGNNSRRNNGRYGAYGAYYGSSSSSVYYGAANGGFFRKLGDEAAIGDEDYMSDAEFFGTSGMENKATVSEGDRKRRLEALLEPDGNIAKV